MSDPILFRGTPEQVDEFLARLDDPLKTPKLEEVGTADTALGYTPGTVAR